MNRRNLIAISAISLFSIIIHCLFISSDFEFHRDELFYIVLGYHPALGYYDLPPLIAYLSFILNITGLNSLFMIRIICALILAVSAFCCYKITFRLSANIYLGYLAALILMLTPVGLRIGILYQYTSLDFMFWNIIIYLFIMWYETPSLSSDMKYMSVLGIISGLALMNKYMVLLLLIGLFLGLLISPKRKMIFRREVLFASLIAFLIVIPNLFWQVYYGFPYLLNAKQIYENQLVNNTAGQFIKDQLLNYGLAGIFWIIFIVLTLSLKRFRRYNFLVIAFVFVISVLLLLKGKSYYSMGLYPVMISMGIVMLYKILKNNILRISVFSVLFLLIAWLSSALFTAFIPDTASNEMPVFFKRIAEERGIETRRWEDGKIHLLPQDYADMLGWKEMGDLTQRSYSQLTEEERRTTVIFAGNYGIASAIEYYGRRIEEENWIVDKNRIAGEQRIVKIDCPIVSSGSSFMQWSPETFPMKTAIVVDDNNEQTDSTLHAVFNKVEVVGKFDQPQARENGLFVYKCSEPKGSGEEFYSNWRKRSYDKLFRKIF